MRQSRVLGVRHSIRGGKIVKPTNMATLEKDFARAVSFGKNEPKMAPDAIRKKFSI